MCGLQVCHLIDLDRFPVQASIVEVNLGNLAIANTRLATNMVI